jgi:hypothetical protein
VVTAAADDKEYTNNMKLRNMDDEQWKIVYHPCHGSKIRKAIGREVIVRDLEDLTITASVGGPKGGDGSPRLRLHVVGAVFPESKTIYIDDQSFLVEKEDES